MIREMEYIYMIYKERSFSQAAKKLHVSQPSLSGMVKKVENSLNITLFDRSTTPISLTPAGKYYVDCAEKILHIKKDMDQYFENLSRGQTNVINLGAASYFCLYVLPDVIKNFHSLFPECQINLVEINALDLPIYLLNGMTDLNVDVYKDQPEEIESTVLYRENVLLAVPANFVVNNELSSYQLSFQDIIENVHLNKNFPAVDINFFRNEPFLLLRKGNDMYHRSLSLCKEAGFTPKVIMEFDQMMSSFYMVQNGAGVAFVRDGIARHNSPTDNVVFYKINEKFATRELVLNSRKGKELSPLAFKFIDFLTKQENIW